MIIAASIISAIATVVIAYYTKINIDLTKSIIKLTEATKESSNKHQEDMTKLQTSLVASIILTSDKNLMGNNLKVLVDKINAFELPQ